MRTIVKHPLSILIVISLLFSAATAETVNSVNSLAALQSASPPTYVEAMFLKYMSVPTDSGGGMFLWDATSGATTDNALVIMPNSYSGAGRWLRQYDGYAYPSWYGALGYGNDDHLAIQAAMNSGHMVYFDQNYCTSVPIDIGGSGQLVDFKGYSLTGISTVAQDAVLQITGSGLTLRNISVNANFEPYNTGVHWFSVAGDNPAQYDRVFGLTIENAVIGLVFGSYLNVQNPPSYTQSEDYIFDIYFNAVQNCIQYNQPNGDADY